MNINTHIYMVCSPFILFGCIWRQVVGQLDRGGGRGVPTHLHLPRVHCLPIDTYIYIFIYMYVFIYLCCICMYMYVCIVYASLPIHHMFLFLRQAVGQSDRGGGRGVPAHLFLSSTYLFSMPRPWPYAWSYRRVLGGGSFSWFAPHPSHVSCFCGRLWDNLTGVEDAEFRHTSTYLASIAFPAGGDNVLSGAESCERAGERARKREKKGGGGKRGR